LSANIKSLAIVITFAFLAGAKLRRESGVLRSVFCVYRMELWQAAFAIALPKINGGFCLRMRNCGRLPPGNEQSLSREMFDLS